MADKTIQPRSLTGFSRDDLQKLLREFGEPSYRAGQVCDWVYHKRVADIDAMSNLSRSLREQLKVGGLNVRCLQHVRDVDSTDTTRKHLFKLYDGRFVETVLIPASPALYGDRSDRHTACVSSQVGCAYDCKFCASGLAGFVRNLQPAEIVEQLIGVDTAFK